MEVFIDVPSCTFPNRSSPKYRFLLNPLVVSQQVIVNIFGDPTRGCQRSMVAPPGIVTYDPIHIRKGSEYLSDYFECPWHIHVVAIQPTHNLPGCTLKSFIQSVSMSAILFANPIIKLVSVALDNVD